jgi:hypothetical protein
MKMETVKFTRKVDRGEISYIRYTLESYDGMAFVKTLDPRESLIEILVSPGCEDLVCSLLDDLVKEEGIRLDVPSSRFEGFHKG